MPQFLLFRTFAFIGSLPIVYLCATFLHKNYVRSLVVVLTLGVPMLAGCYPDRSVEHEAFRHQYIADCLKRCNSDTCGHCRFYYDAWITHQVNENRRAIEEEDNARAVDREAIAKCESDVQKESHKLHFAAKSGDLVAVRRLLSGNANIEEQCGSTRRTPLHMAAAANAHEVVVELITQGANLEARVQRNFTGISGTERGARTALHLAIESDAHDAVIELINRGANINALDDYFQTPLHYAAINNAVKIVTLLVEYGADLEAKSKAYQAEYYPITPVTPLHHAIATSLLEKKPYDTVAALLDSGANIEARDSLGNTSLHFAAALNGISIAIELIDRGANINAINKVGKTPMEFFATAEFVDMLMRYVRQARKIPQESSKSTFPTAKTEAGGVFETIWRSVVVVEAGNSQGSGVALKPNLIATNCHVTDAATSPIVVYKGENRRADKSKSYPARVIAGDRQRDVCLLAAEGLWAIPAETRNAAEMQIAEQVYAVGAPRGLDFSISGGLVSQLREEEGSASPLIQTDTAISPGSSGGGLFDAKGKLVGLTTFGYRDSEGLNFAVPIEWALELISDAEQ